MINAKNSCVYDSKAGTLICDSITEAIDLEFDIKNGKWTKPVADLFTLDDKTKKFTFNFA